MIKRLSFVLVLILGLTNCKNQKEENASLTKKQNTTKDSKYLLEKDEDTKALNLENLKGKKLLFKCKENDNGMSRYDDPLNKTCVCNDSTFNDAYKIFYNEAPDYLKEDLLKKLPQKNLEWKSPNAEVTYSWILQDTLKINMFFQGGENNYVFYKNSDNKIEYKEYLGLP